jgi:hemolysin type calcium-binding protein
MLKKILLISVAILALQAPTFGHAETKSFSLLLAGGAEPNTISIWLTPDGTSYVIDSIVPLEVGGDVCAHPEGKMNELVCQAPLINGFEVNSGGGDDQVTVAVAITVPVTMRGGSGNDLLEGGSGEDRLFGAGGNDRLIGGRGSDTLNGGPDNDAVFGGPGNDILLRGSGEDVLRGGPGDDEFRGPPAKTKARRNPVVTR